MLYEVEDGWVGLRTDGLGEDRTLLAALSSVPGQPCPLLHMYLVNSVLGLPIAQELYK